ncbi:hypothetical protein E5198_15735 [Pseudomonas sp. A-1]|uniref:AAA family ATPase n=1 Tax=Pseudomonas sp. A-1 TaxID=1821274 RepID=UPI0010A694FE|nr:AAA family ATPase [Pseudomonas sp. A-1]THG78384.1 hypothetical protein E5198_15735 [Pseudomonas sp. A-1]
MQYLHFTSRDLDPHLHVHLEIPNMVQAPDGGWLSLDASELFDRQREIALLFDAALAHALRRDVPELAVSLYNDLELFGLMVAGIGEEQIRQFSSRRAQILSCVQEMAESGAAAKRAAAKRTRNRKQAVDTTLLRQQWSEALTDIHLAPAERQPPSLLLLETLLFKGGSVFDRLALDRLAAQLAIDHGGLDGLEILRSELIRQMRIIPLPISNGRQLYTTLDMIEMERDLLHFASASRFAPQFALQSSSVTAALASFQSQRGFELRDEQAHAVHHAAQGNRLALVQGAAGVGKSASLAALKIAYETDGRRVIGLAPSGAAAAELEKSSGIASSTIHALLMKLELGKGDKRFQLQAGDVLIVDEAGMIDTRTLHRLASHASQAGAKLVLVGDERQLEAVGSASTFAMLGQQIGRAEIIEIARQADPADRAISQTWYEGEPGQALQMMQNRDLLRISGDHPTSERLLADALQLTAGGSDWQQVLLLADRNQDVRQLNERVREARLAAGEIEATKERIVRVELPKQGSAQLRIAPGDRLLLRKNAELGGQRLYNGDRAVLMGIDERPGTTADMAPEVTLRLRLDRGSQEITVPLSEYAAFQHGYAMTVHKSQGLTVDHALYLGSAMSTRRAAYVAFTRARQPSRFYLDADDYLTFARNTASFRSKACALDAIPSAKAHSPAPHEAMLFSDQPDTLTVLNRGGNAFSYPGRSATTTHLQPTLQLRLIGPSSDRLRQGQHDGYRITEVSDHEHCWQSLVRLWLKQGWQKLALMLTALPSGPSEQRGTSYSHRHGKLSPQTVRQCTILQSCKLTATLATNSAVTNIPTETSLQPIGTTELHETPADEIAPYWAPMP